MQLPCSLTEFARQHNLPITTVSNHMKQGYCSWPRRVLDGISKDPAYKCWENMVQRATNSKATKAHNYYEKGIDIHLPWVSNFRLFLEHIGQRPSPYHSIDRIDNTKGYHPGNVRWATLTQQAANKSYQKTAGNGIEKHGRWYRFVYQGKKQKYHTWAEAAEAKDNIYGKGYW